MNPEHKGDSTSFSNPVTTRADSTYSIRLNRIKIVDLNTSKASVTNDIQNVRGGLLGLCQLLGSVALKILLHAQC